jgi:hypothetical protein
LSRVGEVAIIYLDMRRRSVINSLVAFLPLLSGFALFEWLELGPKSWIDPACGASLLSCIPFFIVAPLVAGIRSRMIGRGWPTTAALVIAAAFLTAAACVLGFLTWFGKHHCGE